jgi:aromatic ring-opening dioxygenase catalytic subunit (LigB family)
LSSCCVKPDKNVFFNPSEKSQKTSIPFNEWLKTTVLKERNLAELENWENAPGARILHPREEHLLPLLVFLELCMKMTPRS